MDVECSRVYKDNYRKIMKKKKYGNLLKVDVDYPEMLDDKHNGLLFLAEKMRVEILRNKKKYVIYIRALD